MSDKVLQIDLEKIIESKSPKLRKMLPGFVIKYLKRIIHQDEINVFLRNNDGKEGLDFVDAILNDFEMKIEVVGEDKLPESGRYVFVANHPIGGVESIAFIKVISKKFPDLKFPVNDILMALKPMGSIFIPINKHGAQSREAIREIDEYFSSDKQILYFPAGLCSRKVKGKIVDLEWKKTIISKAIQHNRDIITVYIDGRNSNFFYNLANFRNFLGIKANLEMLYLVDETFKQFFSTMRLVIGEPISYTKFSKEKSLLEWAEHLRTETYRLSSQLPIEKA